MSLTNRQIVTVAIVGLYESYAKDFKASIEHFVEHGRGPVLSSRFGLSGHLEYYLTARNTMSMGKSDLCFNPGWVPMELGMFPGCIDWSTF